MDKKDIVLTRADRATGYRGFPEVFHASEGCFQIRNAEARSDGRHANTGTRRMARQEAEGLGFRPCSSCG